MPAAPPRFTPSPSSLGDRGGGGGFAPSRSNRHSQRPTNHKRPTPTRNSNFEHSRGPAPPRAPSSHASGGVAGVGAVRGGGGDDPVVSSRRALGSAKMPASDLDNVNRLFALLGALVGVLLAVALVQGGVNSTTLAGLVKLPGDLYINAMLCVIVPTVFLNSILASMHFWTLNKAKALFYKMLAYFVVTTLWASVLGMLVGVCAAPLFSAHSLTRTTSAIARGKAAVSLRCPRSPNASIVLSDGAMSCQTPATSANGTIFLLQDLSDSFRFRGDPRDVVTLADAMMKLLDSFFPANAIQAFLQGDLLSVIIIGAALGIALIHKSAVRTRELTPGFRTPAFNGGAGNDGSAFSGYLFLLIMQSELVLSVILRFLLKALPIALVSMVAGGILEAHAIAPPESSELSSSTQDLVTLFGVVLFALLLHFATIMAATMLIAKSNPFRFTKHLLPAQLVALSSSSSLVALPSTVRSIAASKQVSMPLAHFVCSTGIVLNKNGSALYLSVASVYILVTSGFRDAAMDTTNLVLLSFVGMLCSFLTPPMPRGNVAFITTILWSIFGVQSTTNLSRMVLFLATMDWLLDPFVTAINVTNNCLIALILSVQMDETYIEFGKFDAVSDTQEEDSNDGFPLDESDRHPMRQRAESRGAPSAYSSPARDRADTHGSGTMRPPMIARMTSVGESVVSV